jgi:N6-L-threonylcarbamoyladenine synthase
MKVAGARPGYYAATGEDALIMWRDLASGTQKAAEPRVADGPGDTLILAIESSCDETAAAVIRGERTVVADVVATLVDFHARYGGVVPEIASRKHTEAIVGVVVETMERAGEALQLGRPLAFRELDALAVTQRSRSGRRSGWVWHMRRDCPQEPRSRLWA